MKQSPMGFSQNLFSGQITHTETLLQEPQTLLVDRQNAQRIPRGQIMQKLCSGNILYVICPLSKFWVSKVAVHDYSTSGVSEKPCMACLLPEFMRILYMICPLLEFYRVLCSSLPLAKFLRIPCAIFPLVDFPRIPCVICPLPESLRIPCVIITQSFWWIPCAVRPQAKFFFFF